MNLRKLGLAGIVAASMFGSENPNASAQGPVIFYEMPAPVFCPPVVIEPQIIVYPLQIIKVTPKIESICFDLPKLEPGEYITVIETRDHGYVVGGIENKFTMNPVTFGRITSNSKQNLAWNVNISGHYDLFISGSGKRLKVGCANLNSGDKIKFVKTSESFDEDWIIKPHPSEPGKMIIKKEPLPKVYTTGPHFNWIINPDGSLGAYTIPK